MSTRASVQIIDGDNVLYFYQHSDGYPEGLGKTLQQVLAKKNVSGCLDDAEYLAGFLLMEVNRDFIERNLSLPDLVPAFGVHGDEAYTYRIDSHTLQITTLKGAKQPRRQPNPINTSGA